MAAKTEKQSSWPGRLFLILLLIGGAYFMPIAVILVVGLLPTATATLIERQGEHTATMTVGPLNIAGVVPLIIELFDGVATLDRALILLADPSNWLVMYGSAAAGWMLFYAIPPVVTAVVIYRSEQRLQSLRQQQEQLVEEWGQEVSGQSEAPPSE